MAVQMPVPIKVEEDVKDKIKLEAEVIDLDDYTSSEERIRRWNSKVRRKNQPLYENDEDCEFFFSLMKWYTETLAEDIIDTDICDTFIQHLNSHLNFYCCTFVKSKFHGFKKEQYLSHMEDILAINLNYEVELFMKDQKRYKKLHRKKMLRKLQTFLFYDTDSYFNVLLKVKFNRFGIGSEASKIYWNFIFKFVLSKGPKSTTDLDFARAYFLHEKWKKVNGQTFHKIIEDMLFTTYSRGPEDIASNQHIQEILRPPKEVLGFIAHQTNDADHCKSFLAYVIKMKEEETMRLVTQVLEKDDSESVDSIVESQEDMKQEDDCIIIGEGTVGCSLNEPKIMFHEILDDEDIASIIYFIPEERSEAVDGRSFLESISIPESSADKENRNPKEKSIFGPSPVPQHTFKLQSSNSVQSREKQSRKFTRKKAVDSTVASLDESIDLDSVESLEHPSIDIIDDEQEMLLSSDDDQPPSPSFSDLEICPTNSILETCHSTLSSNSDLFNVPTSEQTYISPTSPDISSTFEPENIEQESEENSACENETEENSVCADETEKNRVCEKDTTDALQCTFGSNTIDQEESAEENSLYEKDTTDALRCTFGSNTIELEESAEENSVCKTDMSQSIKSSTKTAGSAIIRRILKDFSIETADSIQNTLISTRTTKNNRWHSSTPTDLNSSTSADDATSSTTVSTNVMTEDSTTQKDKAAVTKTVTRRNGHIEHNNNDVNKDPLKNMFNKQLNVNLTRLDLQQEKSGDKILFTSKSKLNKFEEKSNIKFKALTKEDGLDDGLTGDLGKISNLPDMSIILDLFEESSSHKPNNNTNVESEGVKSNSDVDQGCNKDTAKSIVSPENDDFNRYICDLREHGNRTPSIPARKSQEKQEEEVPTKKRKICFAEKLVVATAGSADKMYPKSYKHQGVLKKLKRKWRIPPNIMTSQSFSDYGIQPTDPLLQAESFVVVNKLSDEEIDKWLRGKTCDDTKMKKTERTDLKATVLLRVH
ncbi:uncharacterized protein LOC114336771 isoform X3 [Diabrotica virgifera virgifera]|uniref:Uncharacterized protein n=1 Tax=Diabrotica virgifera virgifera TaxID=50390 RepID=A0ABM5KTI3_DIAVI|nr:uncharacterized protein LOC114336771 isoform X3 [Diabrotica virgifera virgifera]